MKVNRLILFIILITNLAPAIFASNKTNAIKVGIIDARQLFEKSPQAKDVRTRMENEFGKRRQALTSQEENLREKYSKLQRDREIMTQKEVTTTERELEHLRQDLVRSGQEFQADASAREREEEMAFKSIVDKIVREIAMTSNYDLILAKQQSLYSSTAIEITDLVVEKLVQKYKKEQQ